MEEEMLISSAEAHSAEASSLIPDETPPRKPRPFSAPASETAYGLRENPKKTSRVSPTPTPPRTKRRPKPFALPPTKKKRRGSRKPRQSFVFAHSEAEEVADAAMSLLMISRDQWIRVVANPETSAESEASPLEEERKKKKKRRYVCVTCKKSFGSFQALGGHRANHTRWDRSHGSIGAEAPMIEGRHECNVCQKVFKSGQALGGHKRSHCEARSAAKKKKPCQLPTVTETETETE